jgi:hypothetical protein
MGVEPPSVVWRQSAKSGTPLLFKEVVWQVLAAFFNMARGRGLTRCVKDDRPGLRGCQRVFAASPRVSAATRDKIIHLVKSLVKIYLF